MSRVSSGVDYDATQNYNLCLKSSFQPAAVSNDIRAEASLSCPDADWIGNKEKSMARTKRLTACLWILAAAAATLASGVPAQNRDRGAATMRNEKWVLDGAEERIEKYRKGTMELQLLDADGAPLPSGISLKIEQTKHAFYFGGSITSLRGNISDELVEQILDRFAEIFNYATAPFYWSGYEHKEGSPGLSPKIQEIVDWCKAKGMTVKGHPIVWHQTVPNWLESKPDEEVDRLIRARVANIIAQHPDMDHWDVINEAVAADAPHNQSAVGRWITRQGSAGKATEIVLDIASKQNPDKFYLVNCYTTGDKYREQLQYLTGRQAEFDAIGIQSHWHTSEWLEDKTWEIIEQFAKFGKPIHFTEATILSGEIKPWSEVQKYQDGPGKGAVLPDWPSTAEGEAHQAQRVADFYTLLFSHPQVEAIVWWNICDYNAWRKAPAGLLDKDAEPKPAYNKLHDLIKNKWWTKAETATDASGAAKIRGFYGDYRVSAELNGKTLAAEFSIGKSPGTLERISVRLK
jgi:endo-1,4-beta-xylanase